MPNCARRPRRQDLTHLSKLSMEPRSISSILTAIFASPSGTPAKTGLPPQWTLSNPCMRSMHAFRTKFAPALPDTLSKKGASALTRALRPFPPRSETTA